MIGVLHETEFSRRTFLRGGGALVVAIGAAGAVTTVEADGALETFPIVDPGQLDSWLAIDSQGKVTAFTGRVDQGQGKETSYGQTVAEELFVPFSDVTIVMGDTARAPNQGKSTATNGITTGLPPLRNAAAQARGTLLSLAAAQLGVSASQLTVSNGVVSVVGNAAQNVSYASLIGGKHFNVTMPVSGTNAGNAEPGFPYPAYSGATTSVNVTPSVPLKDPSTYTIVGQSVPRVDIPAKVTGTYAYTQNITLPGMLHARAVLPPFAASYPAVVPELIAVKGFHGTKPPGVQVITKGNFVAVVAPEEYYAIEGAALLQTEWAEDPNLPDLADMSEVMRNSPNNSFTPTTGVTTTGAGYSPNLGTPLTARYDFPFTTHGMIGPSVGVASWDANAGVMTLWSGMQNPPQTRAETASLLGLNLDQVRVIWAEQSSMFGRGGVDDVTPAAAYLSMQLGKPIRLQWMRHDEHVWGPHMPGMTQDLAATLGSNGMITSWYAQSWAPVAGWDVGYNLPAILMGTASGLPHGSTAAASSSPYSVPNTQTIAHSIDPPVRGMYMRTVQGLQNTFISESFMDELAAAAGVDPIQFRLNHLPASQSTAIATLNAVEQLSNWQSRPSPMKAQSGTVVTGRGVGLTSTVAHVAEVEVNTKNGQVKVTKLYSAVNIGSLVNPDGTLAQAQGGSIMGLSRALKDEVTFSKNQISSNDWVTYPIVRFLDIPDSVEIVLVPPTTPTVPNGGIGEPSSQAVPAAVGNAIFDATGVRIRRTPFRAPRVRAALKAAGIT
jgi:nicotinate dehydrogenase subunit B